MVPEDRVAEEGGVKVNLFRKNNPIRRKSLGKEIFHKEIYINSWKITFTFEVLQ